MLTFRVFWRRLRVLKFGTAQSRSISRSKLDEPGRLPQRHAEQHFHGQAGLDGVRRENSPPDCFLILLVL